jgi:hypothetical protein
MIPGPDRPDYWLAALSKPIHTVWDNDNWEISHLVLAARWEGTAIATGAMHLPLALAYVLDQSLLRDAQLDFSKCKYVAIALGSDTTGGAQAPTLKNIMAGTIGRAFGLGKRQS